MKKIQKHMNAAEADDFVTQCMPGYQWAGNRVPPRAEKCTTLMKVFNNEARAWTASHKDIPEVVQVTAAVRMRGRRLQHWQQRAVTQAPLKTLHSPCSNLCRLGSMFTGSALARSKLTQRAASRYTQATTTPGCYWGERGNNLTLLLSLSNTLPPSPLCWSHHMAAGLSTRSDSKTSCQHNMDVNRILLREASSLGSRWQALVPKRVVQELPVLSNYHSAQHAPLRKCALYQNSRISEVIFVCWE